MLNYTKAAEDLYIAQPTLSVANKRMEEDLGIKLFTRGKGGGKVELTDAGRVMHEYVTLALNNYETGIRVAREVQGEFSSALRVGTIYAMQGLFWSDAMQAFISSCSLQPEVEIEQAYSAMLIERLRKGELDVAFAARVPGDEDLNRVLVWSQPLVLAVHKSSPWAKKKAVTLQELQSQPILTYTEKSPGLESLKRGLPLADMDLHYVYDDEITLSGMVSSDVNKMAFFYYSFLVDVFPDVHCLPVIGIPSDFHKIYLTSNKESKPRIVNEFIEFMSKYRFLNIQDLRP